MEASQLQVNPPTKVRVGPTARDLLIAHLKEHASPGAEIPRESLARLCRLDPTSSRFGTGLGAARRRLEETEGIVWETVWGQGKLRCLDPGEQMLHTAQRKRDGLHRSGKRLALRLACVKDERLDEDQQKEHRRLSVVAGVVGAFTDLVVAKALPLDGTQSVTIDPLRLLDAYRTI